MHEEAQIVLACVLQALQDSDRMNLEMWLEQADAMGLERLLQDVPPLLGPLNQHLMDLEESERGALKRHEETAELRNEGPSERMWRLAVSAFEAKDEETLLDLLQESKSLGLDVSAVMMLAEELGEERAARERAARPSWAYKHADDFQFKEPKKGAKSSWNEPSSWATPGTKDWKDPSSWTSTDDFLNAWREWKHQERCNQYGDDEAARMKRDEEACRNYQTKQAEERRRREHLEKERQRMFFEEQERQNKRRQQGYGYGDGSYGASGSYGGSFNYSNYAYGGSYGQQRQQQQQQQRSTPASSSGIGGTQEALRALGFPSGRVPPLPEVKAAYKKAAMRAHPDRPHNRGRQEEATVEFQKVKAAFDLLADAAPPR
jgi:hypothetical protein